MSRLTETETFIRMLAKYNLTTQQKKTLKGQAIAGDLEGAQKGLNRILKKKEGKHDS